ncbi:unnamed protein product [Heterobilharzia americana]|nr:unnamed protein product [Heterobilharzia americana]
MDKSLTESFSSADFDARLFVSYVVGTNKVSDVLCTIDNRIRELGGLIQQHVADNHVDLFKRASDIDKLQNVLQMVENRIQNLSVSISKVKKKIDDPHETLSSSVTHFRNLHITCSLLRNISRIATLMKRIQSRSKDLCQSSMYMNEMEFLLNNMNWEGIHDMVSQSWDLVNSSYELSDQAQLATGLQVFYNLNMLMDVVHELATRWKTEFNSVLSNSVDIDSLTQRMRTRQQIQQGTSGPGRASLSAVGGQAAAFHVAVWTSLDGAIDKMEQLISRSRLLGITLMKQRETRGGDVCMTSIHRLDENISELYPSLAELLIHEMLTDWQNPKKSEIYTSILLIFSSANFKGTLSRQEHKTDLSSVNDFLSHKIVDGNRTALRNALEQNEGFLGWASDEFAAKLSSISNQSPIIKEVLEGEYPKLLKLILDLGRRVTNTLSDDLFIRSVSRLFDRVTLAFSTSTTAGPDNNELNDIVQTAVNELAYATVHHDLLFKVCRNLDKLIALFATKVEALVSTGTSSTQLIDCQTSEQQNNIYLVNLLCQFGTHLQLTVSKRLNNLNVLSVQDNQTSHKSSGSTTTTVQNPLQLISESTASHLNHLCSSILDPLLSAIGKTIDEILSTMHNEYDHQNVSSNESSKSKYLQELQNFTARIRQQYLCDLSKPPKSVSIVPNIFAKSGCYTCGEFALQNTLKPMLDMCINNFLWRSTLIRSSNESLRLHLSVDCKEFELALMPLCSPNYGYTLSELVPESYRNLREFSSVLTLETEKLVKMYASSDDTSTLHQVNCHQVLSTNIYLAGHQRKFVYLMLLLVGLKNDTERLALLHNSLSAYVHEVQLRQQREYPPIYLQLKEFSDYYFKKEQV